jgi:hypothetical protein
MNKQKDVSFDEVSREFDKRTAGADQLRAEQLQQLIVVRQAKATGLKREEARLTKKLGASHPRVAEFSARRNMNSLLARDLNLEVTRARTEIPQVDEKTWVVFGRVRDQELKGVPNLTIVLYDEQANWVKQLGYACTGTDGSFRLSTQSFAEVKAPVFVNVLTAQVVRLYADEVPMTPTGGRFDYREIILPAGAQACSPPTSVPKPPDAESGAWIVRGRVTDEAGKGLGGLTVSLYDKDLFFDDRLGETETDESGDYSLTYHTEEFRDLIERKPDIYLKVMDQKGKTVYTSKETIKYESGRIEIVNVVIAGQKNKD